MRLLFKITIPIIILLVIFSSFLFLRYSNNALLICENRILDGDQCTKYLNEKYKGNPVVSHFLDITDTPGFGIHIENFQARPILPGSIENNLLVEMQIDPKTDIMTYRCTALEDPDNIFVEIENPTIEDIDNNRCFSFDSSHLKSTDDLKCEQIGGNPNHPKYYGCVVPSMVCNHKIDDPNNPKGCLTGHYMCKDLGGKVLESLSCKNTLADDSGEPIPCNDHNNIVCEFPTR